MGRGPSAGSVPNLTDQIGWQKQQKQPSLGVTGEVHFYGRGE